MERESLEQKFLGLLQNPGALTGVLVGLALLVALIVFVVVVMVRKRRLLHHADCMIPASALHHGHHHGHGHHDHHHDHGHHGSDKTKLMGGGEGEGSVGDVGQCGGGGGASPYQPCEVALVDEGKA